MNSIGEYLQTIRKDKQINLEDVEKRTKIKQRILQQVEDNQLQGLGGMGYAKAIIFTYGRFLEADEKKLEHLFQHTFDEKPKHSSIFSNRHPKRFLIPGNIVGIILLIFAIIILGLVTIYLYRQDLLTFPQPKKLVPQVEEVEQQTNREDHLHQEQSINRQSEVGLFAQEALADTTDYVNMYLFHSQASPFNEKHD